MVYRLIYHAGVGRTREEFVNHEPQASVLRILRVIKRAINQVLSVNAGLFCSIFHEYEFIQSANFIFL